MQQRGFTYLAVLFMIALMGVMLASVATMWHTARQREKERELLFIGSQFRLAVERYYEKSPGAQKQYPARLEDLLKDSRFVTPQRHLRRVYRDPMTGGSEWGLVKAPQGGIMGIYSLSQGAPLKTGNFHPADKGLEGKQKYAEWVFFYMPRLPGQPAAKAPQPLSIP